MRTPVEASKPAVSSERLVAIELRRIIARDADSIAQKAWDLLGGLTATPLHSAQINGLLAVANTSASVTAVKQFLERQGARRREWQEEDLAGRLLAEIRALGAMAQTVAQDVQQTLRERHGRSGPEVDALTQQKGRLPEVYHLLVREFVQAFGIGYLYRKAQSGAGEPEEE